MFGAGIGLEASDPAATCQQVKALGGDKPLTLIYEGLVNLKASPRQSQPIPATPDSAYFVEQLGAGVGSVNATVLGHEIPKAPFSDPDIDPGLAALDKARIPIIAAKEPGSVLIEIDSGRENKGVWKDKLEIATFGTIYYLPLPGPLVFRKKSLSANFTETGSLKSLQYGSNTGAGQALNVIGAGLSGPNQAAATRAAEIKAEVDVIAQQQRLIACRSDPTTCKWPR
ncbi:hypothetical protein [Polymorphobacter megasporae]|uniref:hypothetical protein n=1 Tax=Glacieibacterium megasporae TaxID=2835787 RepID=UPI001C1E285E|nr:hypothetical protein [Polymorphobacter megasporae]UAJ11063.1 hypothetical protein KTC28_04955 [Polymorphobacter megasporae]